MQAQKLHLKTNAQGKLEGLPDFLPNQDIELILLFSEDKPLQPKTVKRQPPPELAGKIKIVGDIISPVVDAEEWDVLR